MSDIPIDGEHLRLLELGVVPEAGVPAPVLVQSETSTILIFNAMRLSNGRYDDAGRAIVRFERCSITKFGYPNDEAWAAIPRTRGGSYDFFEVMNSAWDDELSELNRHAFPTFERGRTRHFMVLFHDSSFECLAQDLSVTLSDASWDEILRDISNQIVCE